MDSVMPSPRIRINNRHPYFGRRRANRKYLHSLGNPSPCMCYNHLRPTSQILNVMQAKSERCLLFVIFPAFTIVLQSTAEYWLRKSTCTAYSVIRAQPALGFSLDQVGGLPAFSQHTYTVCICTLPYVCTSTCTSVRSSQ